MIKLSHLLKEEDASQKAKQLGLVHLGGGYYGKQGDQQASHMSQNGTLVPVKQSNTPQGGTAQSSKKFAPNTPANYKPSPTPRGSNDLPTKQLQGLPDGDPYGALEKPSPGVKTTNAEKPAAAPAKIPAPKQYIVPKDGDEFETDEGDVFVQGQDLSDWGDGRMAYQDITDNGDGTFDVWRVDYKTDRADPIETGVPMRPKKSAQDHEIDRAEDEYHRNPNMYGGGY